MFTACDRVMACNRAAGAAAVRPSGGVRPGGQNPGTVAACGGQRERRQRAAGVAGAGIAKTAACQGHTIVGVVEAAAVVLSRWCPW